MGMVGDTIQMRPATICLMADRYKVERRGGREMKREEDSMQDI